MISRKTYPKESMFNMFAMLESLIHETIADVKRIYYDNSLEMIEAFANPIMMQSEIAYDEMEAQSIDVRMATGETPLPSPGINFMYVMGPAIKTQYEWRDTVKHHGKFGYSYDYAGFESKKTVMTFDYYLFQSGTPEIDEDELSDDNSQVADNSQQSDQGGVYS